MSSSRLQRVKNFVDGRNFDAARRVLEEVPTFGNVPANEFLTYRDQIDKLEDTSLISRDRGNGRASRGIQFLELVSLSFSGKELGSLLRFDKVPRFIDPTTFSVTTLTDVERVRAVAKSLGVEEFLTIEQREKSAIADTAFSRFLLVFDEVREGTFRVSSSRSLLALCRILVRTAINTRNNLR